MSFSAAVSNGPYALYIMIAVRMMLACILGGVIGFERESTHRPAGFRTHILVCVGAALVMITSEFIFERYRGLANIDPARLGAQVISGIGFLGAGTIIREGFNVKGLTTAASLWAVSCVGIAVGIGFYGGAVAATIVVYITLMLLKPMEKYFANRNYVTSIYIYSDNITGQVGTLSALFEKYNIQIKSVEFTNTPADSELMIKFSVKIHDGAVKYTIMDELQGIKGIRKVCEK